MILVFVFTTVQCTVESKAWRTLFCKYYYDTLYVPPKTEVCPNKVFNKYDISLPHFVVVILLLLFYSISADILQ